MNEFLIISNNYKDTNLQLAERISDYIKSKGKTCSISHGEIPDENSKYRYTNPMKISDTVECIITIGGDGTLIQAAKDMMDKDAVFIGINLGKLGYLAEIDKEDFERTIDSLIKGDYTTEKRMLLCGKVIRNNTEITQNVALNDIVLHRGATVGLINFNIYVNGKYLSRYDADGVIFSTPTGSTAYNLSAGGPIVKPDARLILLTPICAHSINNHSIVLSEDDEIIVEICDERNRDVSLTFDGDNAIELQGGDKIIISRDSSFTKIAKLGTRSFIEILKEKMGDK